MYDFGKTVIQKIKNREEVVTYICDQANQHRKEVYIAAASLLALASNDSSVEKDGVRLSKEELVEMLPNMGYDDLVNVLLGCVNSLEELTETDKRAEKVLELVFNNLVDLEQEEGAKDGKK